MQKIKENKNNNNYFGIKVFACKYNQYEDLCLSLKKHILDLL